MAKRVDSNQREIIAAFDAFGWQVVDLHELGHGCPDLFVRPPDACYGLMIEVKNGPASYTDTERAFYQVYPGLVHTVRSVDDVVTLVERWK